MKKTLKAVVIIVLCGLIGAPNVVYSQNLNKLLEKEYKKKLKEYKKDGWKVDSDRSAEVVLMKHYNKLNNNEDLKTVIGTSSNCKSTNVCKQAALNSAQNYYARLVSGKIEGAFSSVVNANSSIPQEELDKMVGGLTNEVKADLSGLLQPSYSIYREKNGMKEYHTIFLVDEKVLVGNMEKVLERSLKETKLTIEEARSISKFVSDELKKDSGTGEE